MSKSLTPGLVEGISRNLMTISVGDVAAMSRSSMAAAGFHLSSVAPTTNGSKKGMHASVDKLFEEGDVFNSSCRDVLPTISEKPSPGSLMSPLKSPDSVHSDSTPPREKAPLPKPQPPPKPTPPPKPQSQPTSLPTVAKSDATVNPDMNTSGLWIEFQKQKRLLEQLMNDDDTRIARDARNRQFNTPPMAGNLRDDANYVTPGKSNQSPVKETLSFKYRLYFVSWTNGNA